MHPSLLILGLLGLAGAWVIPGPETKTHVVPPSTNPNQPLKDHEGKERKASDPLPPSEKSTATSDALSDANCDVNGIMSASGQDLVKRVSSVTWRCINDNFFLITGDKARQACNEADVLTIAQAFYYPAEKYDGNNPQATPEIHPLATYLRACYYVQYYNSKDTGNYSTNSHLATLRYGFDKFLQRPNLESKNDEHLDNLNEIVSLISGVHDQQNYIVRIAQLFNRLSNALKFDAYSQGNAMVPLFDNYFRVHGDAQSNDAKRKEMNDFFARNIDVPKAMYDFLEKQRGLVNTDNEWLIRNAALELPRFLMYPSLNAQVSSWIKTLLQKYTSSSGDKVWAQLMNQITNYDPKNCAQYNACNFKVELEKKILPYTKSCGKTYVDTFVLRYQSMSDAEANQVCQRLKDEESYFHNLVKDSWKPVTPDTNDKIEVVVFNTRSDYQMYANMFFGIDTNNGGMYLEGDPSKAGNVARYLCYESPYSLPAFDVWNLEHEFVHYLDGRYDMKGDFGETSSGSTVWWIEGFAEYASKKNNGPTAVQDCKEKKYPLSTIFQNQYGVGEERIYHYGYLAVRFMFDRHRNDVDTILQYFRSGKYPEFKSWFSGIGSRYDQEFNQWCDCVAKGTTSSC